MQENTDNSIIDAVQNDGIAEVNDAGNNELETNVSEVEGAEISDSEAEAEEIIQDDPSQKASETDMPSEDDGDEVDAEDEDDGDDVEPDEEDDLIETESSAEGTGAEKSKQSTLVQNRIKKEIQLSEGITKEARCSEELDIGLLDSKDVLKAYLKVSDDRGQFINKPTLYRKFDAFLDRYKDIENMEIQDPKKLLEEAKTLLTEFGLRVNIGENVAIGVGTKYRIMQGMGFRIMKVVAKEAKHNWMTWFRENFDQTSFRSVSDYMQLSRVPNILKYSVFGKERLLAIVRLIDGLTGEDPIGLFLEDYHIVYNPTQETNVAEIKILADVAVNRQRLIDAGLDEITEDQVNAFVRNGKEITPKIIQRIKEAKQDGDAVGRMDRLISSDAYMVPATPQEKTTRFKDAAKKFLDILDEVAVDSEYRTPAAAQILETLKAKVAAIEGLIQPEVSDAAA